MTYFFPKEYVLRLSCKYMYVDFVLFKGDIVFHTTCFFNHQNQFTAYPSSLFNMHLHIYEYIQKHKVLFVFIYVCIYIYITYVYMIYRCMCCTTYFSQQYIYMCGRLFIHLYNHFSVFKQMHIITQYIFISPFLWMNMYILFIFLLLQTIKSPSVKKSLHIHICTHTGIFVM